MIHKYLKIKKLKILPKTLNLIVKAQNLYLLL